MTRIKTRSVGQLFEILQIFKRYQQRRTFPLGTYEADWTPQLKLKIGVNDFPFDSVYLFDYKDEEQCQNETCGFTSPRKDRMKRHHDNCKDTTEIVTKKICYGLKEEKYMSVIPDSYFENPKFLFAVFDIETAERPSDFAEVGILNI